CCYWNYGGVCAGNRNGQIATVAAGNRLTLTLELQLMGESILDSESRFGYAFPMFDLVRPQIATAADKLTHLRRFL
ncbi:MAG: hypothetical protein ABSF34_03350, partial [Verrucomicrobiota bacterium]